MATRKNSNAPETTGRTTVSVPPEDRVAVITAAYRESQSVLGIKKLLRSRGQAASASWIAPIVAELKGSTLAPAAKATTTRKASTSKAPAAKATTTRKARGAAAAKSTRSTTRKASTKA